MNRRYTVELLSALAVYAVLLVGAIWFVNNNPTSPWRVPIILLPMLPALLIPVVVLRALRRMDELERQIQLEALGFAFAATAVLTFAYGFLERVGAPPMGGFVVWPLMAVLWGIGVGIANRRFR